MAVAEASLRTVNDSISFEFRRFSEFGIPDTPLLSIGTPSITIRGSLLADIDDPPLILIVDEDEGSPPPLVMETPGILPVIRDWGEETDPLLNSFSATAAIEPVASFLATVP